MDGRARPPSSAGRKRMDVFEDLAGAAHFFRNLVLQLTLQPRDRADLDNQGP